MSVNARLSFISVAGFHYSSGGLVILTINPFSAASPFDRPRDTLSNKDRTRPNKTSFITIVELFAKNTNVFIIAPNKYV
jgi:hypothetical protein